MRKNIARVVLGVGVAGLVAAPAAAQAAPQQAQVTHVKAVPATTGTIWTENKFFSSATYSSPSNYWYANNGSFIGPAVSCMTGTGFCEHKDPNNGNLCLTWQSGNDTISDTACSGLARQYWAVQATSQGGGGYTWNNYYADIVDSCSTSMANINGGMSSLQVRCPTGAGGAFGFDQVWKSS